MAASVSPHSFWNYLKKKDFTFFSGVPCSILAGILDAALRDTEITYIPAIRENAALGVASGAYLAGRKSGILIQNSGLGNIINSLTSFNLIYRIPVLMFITWRGYKGQDAPEHSIMGEKTTGMLDTLNVSHVVMSEHFEGEIDWAVRQMEERSLPVAIILKKGLVE